MRASARRRQAITGLIACTLIVSACAKKTDDKVDDPVDDPSKSSTGDKPAPADANPGSTAPAPDKPVAPPTKPAPPVAKALAKRCLVGGDPLATSCTAYNEGMAAGKDGLLYVVVGKQVRRYKRGDGADCTLEPIGEPIDLPADNPRPQRVDKGPVYMRSGGAEWHLLRARDAVYVHDYLGGLFRIDRGRPEAVCDVFGYSTLAALDKKLVIARQGFEELKLGKQCKPVKLGIDDKARGDIYGIRDKLYLASGKRLTRYDGKTPVPLLEDTKPCFVTSVSACGDGLCVLDGNCVQLLQVDAAGLVLRVIDGDQLFATRPFGMNMLVSADSGNLFLRAKHRDSTAGKEICESAIYELPAAVFAR
jgi:hypothetical protein